MGGGAHRTPGRVQAHPRGTVGCTFISSHPALMKCVRTVFAPRPFASVCLCVLIPASATNTCLKPHFNAPPPLGSRFERATQVIGGAGGSLARFRTSDHRLRCAACPSALAAARRRHEAAGARRKVLVVSARARSVMTYDCAVTRMMNGGSRAHVVYAHAHTTTWRNHPCPRPNERTRPRPTADRRSAIDERRATIADRCARAVRGGAPGRCRLVVCGFIFLVKILFHRIPNARHRPWAVGAWVPELRKCSARGFGGISPWAVGAVRGPSPSTDAA